MCSAWRRDGFGGTRQQLATTEQEFIQKMELGPSQCVHGG